MKFTRNWKARKDALHPTCRRLLPVSSFRFSARHCFSLDSVIRAVGKVNEIGIMVTAVVIAVIFLMAFAGPISGFVERHPTVKMLALSFLLLIGMTLIAEGWDLHIPRGYVYSAMAFSVWWNYSIFERKKLKRHLSGYTNRT